MSDKPDCGGGCDDCDTCRTRSDNVASHYEAASQARNELGGTKRILEDAKRRLVKERARAEAAEAERDAAKKEMVFHRLEAERSYRAVGSSAVERRSVERERDAALAKVGNMRVIAAEARRINECCCLEVLMLLGPPETEGA